jgi:hypothetical protein
MVVNGTKRGFWKIFLLTAAHLLALAATYCCWNWLLGIPLELSDELVHKWDAGWYFEITRDGYFYDPARMSSVAFFPLFPLLWQFTGLSYLGICLTNALVFCLAFSWLSWLRQWRLTEQLVLASLPSLMFACLPYTEALFFLISTGFLYAYSRQRIWLTCLFILLCALTRPVATIFVPAFVLAELLATPNGQLRSGLLRAALYGSVALAGLGLVALYQHSQTGVYFGSIYTQVHWQHYFRFPTLPFNIYNGANLTEVVESAGLAVSVLAMAAVLHLIWRRFRGRLYRGRAEAFSVLYLAGTGAAMLFFQGGNLNSLNRYIFATSFFAVAFTTLGRAYLRLRPTLLAPLITAGAIVGFWRMVKLFEGFPYGNRYVFGGLWLGLLAWWAQLRNGKLHYALTILLYLIQLFMQARLLLYFTQGRWTG